MLRRSGSRFGTRSSPTKSEGLAVSDHHPSVITPNHSASPSSDVQFPVSNINGVCATQPRASANNNTTPYAFPSVQNEQQTSTPEPVRHVLGLIESELLRYPCDPGHVAGQPVHGRSKCIQVAVSDCKRVCCQYFCLRSKRITEKIRTSLGSHTFNNWLHSDAQLICYLTFMFTDLNLPQLCHFPVEVLETWLLAVYRRYNDVPFHNFKHAFMVTQMMYAIIKQADLVSCLAPLDLLILLFSAISHDLDHPGYTNSYQVNRRSWLALRYNDVSPLENHHCAVAFDLVSIPATNILVGLSQSEYLWFRKAVIRCILATDMATHRDCVDEFRAVLRKLLPTSSTVPALSENCTLSDDLRRGSLDRTEQLRVRLAEDPDSRIVVLFILLKTCDISNEVRPTPVADPWLDCLLDEFFAQARTEKFLGLPVLPHMDPDKVTRAGSQIGFIEFLLVPLLQDLCTLFPGLKSLENSAKERILYFEIMERESEKSGTQQANPVPLDPSSSSKCLPSEPDAEVDSVQPVRTSSNATAFWLLPRLTDPVSHRGNKLRCLSTPVRPDLTSIAFQSSLDVPSQTTEPVVSRCKCRYSTDELPTGLHGSLLFSARDTVGSKRHHSQQQESVISALFQSDPAYSNKQQVKPDTEPLLSESVAVVAAAVAAAAAAAVASQTTPSTGAVPTEVSRRSSTGSMVAAII